MDISAKERSSNFSSEEVEKLKNLIEKHRDILFCKKTDGVSFNLKESAWKDIHQVFNANATVHRSIKQLKYKFDNFNKNKVTELSMETEVQFINHNTETIDTETDGANMLPVFDSGAPASLLRRPISSPLKRPRERSCNTTMVTPQSLRKSFKVLNDQKLGLAEHRKNIIDQTNIREEQEFQQRLKHKEEMHMQAYRHNEERHVAELRILNLKAQLFEIEIEKLNK